MKKWIVFGLAVALSLAGAIHRWGDSAHAIATISAKGGSVRHPVHLPAGRKRYVMILTARVIPPYRGSARVVLEGKPHLSHSFHYSRPVILLGIKRIPRFQNNIFFDLRPGDRIALWVRFNSSAGARGRYRLVFYDLKSNKPVLTLPIFFSEEESHGH